MFAYIKGIYTGMNKDYIIIENNGIGYKVFTSGSTIANMPEVNKEVLIYTEQIVREDFIGIYGFLTMDELETFKMLLNINGIGAKAALSLLSIATSENLKYAIYTGDEATLTKAPGIGKKTAGRIVLELKDKIKLNNINLDKVQQEDDDDGNKSFLDIFTEAAEALIALGYSEKESIQAVKKAKKGLSLEDTIKYCLKLLMK